MLIISLVLSSILLAAAWWAARRAEWPVAATFSWAVAVTLLPASVMLIFPAVWLQAGILCGGLLIATVLTRGRPSLRRPILRPLAVLSVLIAYGIVGQSALKDYLEEQRKYDRLRAAYPMESLEERLPRSAPPSSPGDPEGLARLEESITSKSVSTAWLRQIHEDHMMRFVSSPGFGQGRMVTHLGPPDKDLATNPHREPPSQPDYFRPALDQANSLITRPDSQAFGRLHEEGLLDFVNPGGFGFVKDRRHVAGFQSHGFSRVPDSTGGWKVASLELVGLLKHEKPAVYLSAKLPRMDELRDAPTRPLDPFEAIALAALQSGQDLHIGENADAGRFLGAIRSTKQCIECHGGDRGALLGAFTYRLQPSR
jgi:hypothetical protein